MEVHNIKYNANYIFGSLLLLLQFRFALMDCIHVQWRLMQRTTVVHVLLIVKVILVM